jgi:hypothetical protein
MLAVEHKCSMFICLPVLYGVAREAGLEPALPESESGVLPLDDSPSLARARGIEPRSSESKSEVLPLDEAPSI